MINMSRLYRIKIVDCLDIVVEMESDEEAINYAKELADTICKQEKAIYVHVLAYNEASNALRDLGRIYPR